jgi:hypothetical protein
MDKERSRVFGTGPKEKGLFIDNEKMEFIEAETIY